jgi:sterol desaturase/sphingolipid hydroxylase (fatty acid hydroxylase superfamily)
MLEWLGTWADGLWNWVVIVTFLALAAWETVRPARAPEGGVASRWLVNIGLYATNAAVAAVFVPAAIADVLAIARLGDAAGDWGVLLVGVLLLDLYAYAIHRVQHRLFVLWRFHAVHHSDTDMDASTTLRHHPVEVLVSSIVGALVFALLGIPEWVFPIYALVGIVVSLTQHMNTHLPERLDHALRWVLVTPGLHRIHHSVAAADHGTNFSTVLSIWDRLFGTYRGEPQAGRGATVYGVPPFTAPEYAQPHWALLLPFALRRPAVAQPNG